MCAQHPRGRETRSFLRRAGAAGVALAMAGCAVNPAPRGYLPSRAELPRSTRGGWVVLEPRAGEPGTEGVWGELLAVESGAVHVLTSTGARRVVLDGRRRARLWIVKTGGGTMAWATLGTLSTLSHGALLVFTAPLWIIAGIVAARAEERAAWIEYPRTPLEAWRPYARFPQGLPEGVDLGTLSLPAPGAPK